MRQEFRNNLDVLAILTSIPILDWFDLFRKDKEWIKISPNDKPAYAYLTVFEYQMFPKMFHSFHQLEVKYLRFY